MPGTDLPYRATSGTLDSIAMTLPPEDAGPNSYLPTRVLHHVRYGPSPLAPSSTPSTLLLTSSQPGYASLFADKGPIYRAVQVIVVPFKEALQ
eukprot:3351332-Rhodomonas_salina.1